MVTARRQQVGLLVEQRRGRLVDFSGHNFLAERRKMEFHIGLHLGEVQVRDEQLFGNGVNIAARLEALAPPDGVCISAKVQEEVAGRTG